MTGGDLENRFIDRVLFAAYWLVLVSTALLLVCGCAKSGTMTAYYPYSIVEYPDGRKEAKPHDYAIDGMTTLGAKLIDRLTPEAAASVAGQAVEKAGSPD